MNYFKVLLSPMGWVGVGILWLIIQLPYKIQLKIGGLFGFIAFYVARREYKTADTNLQKCYPKLDKKSRKKLILASFISAGQGTLETLFGFWGSPQRLKKLIYVKNIEIINTVLKNKNGVIIFAPHFTSVHFAGRLLNLLQPFGVMYFPPKNKIFRIITERALPKCYARAITRHDPRGFIRALKNNTAVLYTPDIDGGKSGLFVPFFNTPASTITATSRFAELTGCAVIQIKYYRRKDQTGVNLEFQEPLTNFPSEDIYEDTVKINQLLETNITEHPE